jgi:hypothetical protein
VVETAERDAAVPQVVQDAWARVHASWDDPRAHDELFALTAQHSCYAWTAARYREVRADKGAASTDPRLERVRKAAEATLLATASVRPRTGKQPYGTSAVVLVIAIIMIVIGLMFAASRPTRPPTAPIAPHPVHPASQVR